LLPGSNIRIWSSGSAVKVEIEEVLAGTGFQCGFGSEAGFRTAALVVLKAGRRS